MNQKNHSKTIGNLVILIAAFIWGSSFVSQSQGAKAMGTFSFNAIRFIIGVVLLVLFVYLRNYKKTRRWYFWENKEEKRLCSTRPLIGGMALFLAMSCQQEGLKYSTASKAGFLTTLYIVIVAVCGIFFHKKVTWLQWIGVALAVVGVGLLSLNGQFQLQQGDVYFFGAAFFFAWDILLIDKYVGGMDTIKLSIFRFLPTAVISTCLALLLEHTTIEMLQSAWFAIFYAGVFSSGIAYTFQAVGQKRTDTITASILMTFESVFAALSGWLFLYEQLSPKELAGCGVMFVSALVVQLAGKNETQAQ